MSNLGTPRPSRDLLVGLSPAHAIGEHANDSPLAVVMIPSVVAPVRCRWLDACRVGDSAFVRVASPRDWATTGWQGSPEHVSRPGVQPAGSPYQSGGSETSLWAYHASSVFGMNYHPPVSRLKLSQTRSLPALVTVGTHLRPAALHWLPVRSVRVWTMSALDRLPAV